MRRRIGAYVIFLIVYVVIIALLDFILPRFFGGATYYGGFFPFFFFPFFLGRGLRSGRRNYGNSPNRGKQDDEMINQNYDTSAWEARNREQYDEFGIPVKKSSARAWYLVGIAAVLAISVLLLLYSGVFSL